MTIEAAEPYHVLLIATAAAVPILVIPYSWLISFVLTKTIGYQYQQTHNSIFYVSFVLLAAVVVVSSPFKLYLFLDMIALGAVPLGVLMYWVDTRVWGWLNEKPLQVTANSVGDTVTFLVGPVPEEIVYRGGLFISFMWLGPAEYVTMSAVLFGINHYSLGKKEVVFKTWNGAVYALLYLYAGTLIAPIVAHLAYNLTYLLLVHQKGARSIATGKDEVSS